jgi:hypothetical protein
MLRASYHLHALRGCLSARGRAHCALLFSNQQNNMNTDTMKTSNGQMMFFIFPGLNQSINQRRGARSRDPQRRAAETRRDAQRRAEAAEMRRDAQTRAQNARGCIQNAHRRAHYGRVDAHIMGASTRSECASTRSECASTLSECASTRSECASTRSECASTRSECASTRSECALAHQPTN